MQRTLLITLLFCLCYILSTAQPYDKTWIVGEGYTFTLTFDGSSIDTATRFVDTSTIYNQGTLCNVSDTAGNLLFFSNGTQVGNSIAQLMENGDTLTDSLFYLTYPSPLGFYVPQSSLILPRSGHTFYLIYVSQSDSLFATNTIAEPDRLYYAVIDMDQNGGLGKVISKKNILYKGLIGSGRLTATRHANGRDWWMVNQGFQNNEYFIYRVTPDSIYGPTIQRIGPSGFLGDGIGAQSVFSSDGSKFATAAFYGPIVTMDFDRCIGVLSKPDSIFNLIDTFLPGTNYAIGSSSICFSPNGRFLYSDDNIQIFQFDTWASNVENSITRVGGWEYGDTLGFNNMYLLPNGQIIVDDVIDRSSNFHLIDSPDIAGLGCAFRFNGLQTTATAIALPNMINYRLGALTGSSCDTITGISTIPGGGEEFSFMPIPATDDLTLRYQAIADFTVRIYSVTGQQMAALYMKANNNGQHIDTEILSTGVYEYEIVRGAMVLQRGRLSVIK